MSQEQQADRFFQGLAGREWKVTPDGAAWFRPGKDSKWVAISATAAVLERSRGVREVFQ